MTSIARRISATKKATFSLMNTRSSLKLSVSCSSKHNSHQKVNNGNLPASLSRGSDIMLASFKLISESERSDKLIEIKIEKKTSD